MNTFTVRKRVGTLVTFFASLIACILLSLSYLFAYDGELGYFRTKAILPGFFGAFLVVFVVFAFVFACRVFPKEKTALPGRTAPPLYAKILLAAAALLVLANAVMPFTRPVESGVSILVTVFRVLTAVGALALAAVLLLSISEKTNENARIGLSMLASLYFLGDHLQIYFHYETPINALPNILGACLAASLLFFLLCRVKARLYGKSGRLTYASGMLAFFFLSLGSLPYITALIAGKAAGEGLLSALLYLILALLLLPDLFPGENAEVADL